jgi:methionine biosynthesis protein MetW
MEREPTSENSTPVSLKTGPDGLAAGFILGELDPLRYDGHILDADEIVGIIAKLISPNDRVLDVGCGTGSVARLLADACQARIVGIEPDEVRAAMAASRGLDVHVGCLSSDLIQRIGQFDVVLFADVLEHLPNPYSELVRAREALRPRGRVILSVPNVAHWSVRVDILRGRFRYQSSGIMDATHLRWFTADGIRSLVTSAGFEVTYYRAAAGTRLGDNIWRRPFSWLPQTTRTAVLRSASRYWPTLFGCQHVVRGELALKR